MVQALFHGFLLALALILPLGPQNTFVLTQGATASRWRSTVPVVITAALSDTLLIGLAVAGVSLLLLAIPALRLVLSLAGVIFLIYVGWTTWSSPVSGPDARAPEEDWSLWRKVRYSLSVSLLNPHAIMDTIVVIGGGAAVYTSPWDKWAYAIAASIVSWLWFVTLSLAGRLLHRVAQAPSARRWINRSSAAIMWAVALRTFAQLV